MHAFRSGWSGLSGLSGRSGWSGRRTSRPRTCSRLRRRTRSPCRRPFEAAGSGVDTVTREVIADDLRFVAGTYGSTDADIAELVAAREWCTPVAGIPPPAGRRLSLPGPCGSRDRRRPRGPR
ncbi:DUF5713 family protein [Streptomyces sp. NPDC058279]|uniref:DUF5713 family protein n=1 Tax=Streptomyces sp. NPDC058279 TaxID=3346418 RepID=UPI0036E1970A